MTYRNRKLLDLAHEAPCFLQLGTLGCGVDASVPCHSDQLEDDRGIGHKSHDAMAVPGCPACHSDFTRAFLGRARYWEAHAKALKRYVKWLWETERIKVSK